MQPFTEQEIAVIQTFADQVVIAIQNARLFEELEGRTTDLARALEQQTAQSEVLRIIASTPADLEGVLQAILDSAGQLCDAEHGVIFQLRERDGRLSGRVWRGVSAEDYQLRADLRLRAEP